MRTRNAIAVWSAVGLLLAATGAAHGAPITITNHSFEADTAAPPAGWTGSGGGAQGTGASDGTNGLWVFSGPISQSLSDTFTAGTQYTMSVDVIDRPGVNTGWDFGLYYDNGGTLSPVATTSGGHYNGGGFVQKDAIATVNGGDAWEGKNIVVGLNRRAASASSDWYDNVRLDAGPAPVPLTTSMAATAPTTDVLISQTGNAQSTPWRTQSGLRQAGQTFLVTGDTVLDAITVNVDSLQNSDLDGDSFTLTINEYANGTDFTPDATLATIPGNLPASLHADVGSGKTYLTFDIPDVALSPGKQYGFFLDPTGFSSTSNFLLEAQANSSYTDGIGLKVGPAEMTVWTGSSQPADLEFYLQGTATAPPVTTSATAPTDNVVLQQATSNGNAPWRFPAPAGTDNNPRDAGQTFLVGPNGMILDKITVRIDSLTTSGYDGESFTLGLYRFSNASDVVPDPDKDSPFYTETFNLPAFLKSEFDAGAGYLTIDLIDQELAPGQYGFLLMHDENLGSAGNNLLLALQTDETSYSDGIAIRRLNRGAGSDAFSAQAFWTGSADSNTDMEFYIQGEVPEPATMLLAGLGLGGVAIRLRRRRHV